jgi:hypothetical protein
LIIIKTCLVSVGKDRWEKAEFHGFYQFSNVVDASPFAGGHPGGVIAYPVALVEIDGELKEVRAFLVKFEES